MLIMLPLLHLLFIERLVFLYSVHSVRRNVCSKILESFMHHILLWLVESYHRK
ncbi:hypothetical protein AMTRI_Chr01g102460 [Amborella trichopoda]